MKDKLKRLAKISVIKTFMFNLVYFGWGGSGTVMRWFPEMLNWRK